MPQPAPSPSPTRNLWPRALLDALLLVAVLLLIFSPPWHAFIAYSRFPEVPLVAEVRRGDVLVDMVKDPFAPVTDTIHRILETRLLVPVIAHVLHLPAVAVFAGPYLLSVVAVAQMLVYARRRGLNRLTSLGIVVLLTTCGWFISSTGWLGYYDSALLIGLLTVAHSRPRWALWLACLLTPWLDERFILALPLAFATRWLGGVDDFFSQDPTTRARFRAEAIAVAALTALYLSVRFTIAQPADPHTLPEYLAGQETLKIGLARHLRGLWESLRFGWCGVIAGLYFLRPAGAPWRWILWIGIAVTTLVSQLIANDLSRAMIFFTPFALEGLIRGGLHWAPRAKRILIPLATAACAIPTGIVVTDYVLPVKPLPTILKYYAGLQLDRTPAEWLADARRGLKAGDKVSAEFKAHIALRLDPTLAQAHNLLGILSTQAETWEKASVHFSEACKLEPANPDLWLNLAFARWKLGDDARYAGCVAKAREVGAGTPALAKGLANLERLMAGGRGTTPGR